MGWLTVIILGGGVQSSVPFQSPCERGRGRPRTHQDNVYDDLATARSLRHTDCQLVRAA